ncbi:hypothetical protein IGI01_11840 [Bacillus thuringiensis]|nr:hypothetical protein [Bacillus thuringiensis]
MQAKAQWKCLYHVFNLKEYTNHYFSKENKKTEGCKVFFKKALRSFYILKPIVITLDKYIVYPAVRLLPQNSAGEKKLDGRSTACKIPIGTG